MTDAQLRTWHYVMDIHQSEFTWYSLIFPTKEWRIEGIKVI